MLRHCKLELYGLTLVLSAAVLIGLAPQAQADGLLANWLLNQPASSTSFPDSSGNGNTGTLVLGTGDTVSTMTGPFGASGPTALNMNTAEATNGNLSSSSPTYINVPYNAELSVSHYSGSTPVGYNAVTLSAWIFLPSNWVASGTGVSPGSEVISLSNNSESTGQIYQMGDGAQSVNNRKFDIEAGPFTATDTNFLTVPGGGATPGSWELATFVYYGGNSNTAQGIVDLYFNGVLQYATASTAGGANGAIPLPVATAGEALTIGNGYGIRDNEWYGGLSDLAVWGIQLTGAPSVGAAPPAQEFGVVGDKGGEILAMYNAPTCGIGALQQYDVSAMDQLFTLYDVSSEHSATAAVTTGNSTLTWEYVPSGLPITAADGGTDGSGAVGQLTDGQYYMVFDTNGGGVETLPAPTPEPSTLALAAAGLLGLLAYAWRRHG